MSNLISLMEKGLDLFFPKKNHSPQAQFAGEKSLLSKHNSGFVLNGKQALSMCHSYQNVLLIGGTGTGKSTTSIIPTILTANSSLVVHDPSGELFTKTALSLKERGFRIRVFNPANPDKSHCFNFLSHISHEAQITKAATTLVNSSTAHSKDVFWNQLAISLLSMLMKALKKGPVRFQNLHNLVHLVDVLGVDHNRVTEHMKSLKDPALLEEYLSFLNYDEKVVSGVRATCKAALNLMSDSNVQQVTATDSLNLKRLRKEKTAIFIQNSVADRQFYTPLSNLFFEVLFSILLESLPQRSEKDVLFLLDEASSLNCPTLSIALANFRKYRVGVLLAIQSLSQLQSLYGGAHSQSISSNCLTKVFYTAQDLQTIQSLELLVGDYEYPGENGLARKRPLLTKDELRRLPNNRALLLSSNRLPILLKLQPYFRNRKFRKIPEVSKVEKRSVQASQLPLLDLSNYDQ